MNLENERKESDMAEQLKYMYNPAFFEKICPVLERNIEGFESSRFIHLVFDNQWPELELKARVTKIAEALHRLMPDNYIHALGKLLNITDDLISSGFPSQGFQLMFLPEYVAMYGQDHPEISLSALARITTLVSAEFAIRPFLNRYPNEAMNLLSACSENPDANVRRFASEGSRPRLPWAAGVPWLKKQPEKTLAILENLKSDSSLYVRKSVANHLNDIAKDHPEVVIDIMGRWKNLSAETNWIIKHGSRTLLKKGDVKALQLHGFDKESRAEVDSFKLSANTVTIGDALHFEFELRNKGSRSALLRLDYGIDYLTSTGKTSTRIFKIAENKVEPGSVLKFERKQSFRDFTTRKHFQGPHRIFILANGKTVAEKNFSVR